MSCTVKFHLPEGELLPQKVARQLLVRMEIQYPDSFQLTQRILLNVAGKEYDFIGYLKMQKKGNFRAMALGELGGTFLDIQSGPAETRILKNAADLPQGPLKEGVAGDIRFLYGCLQKYTPLNSSRAKDALYVELTDSASSQLVLAFDRTKLLSSKELINGKVRRTAQYKDYRKFDGISCALPCRIILENKRWHYKLRIDLLNIKNKAAF